MTQTTTIDQATTLRQLMLATQCPEAKTPNRTARTLAFTSGKGGVGKSVLALNVAVALQKQGGSVCLLDACLGLGNLDLLCGVHSYWNLAHVCSGARRLEEVIVPGPCGVSILPGASAALDLKDCSAVALEQVLSQLIGLEQTFDFLVIDTGPGLFDQVRKLALMAELVCVIATPEPTAVADAYSSVRALLADSPQILPQLIVNEVDSPEQAQEILARVQQTARSFLSRDVAGVGYVPYDQAVPRAVARRSPTIVDSPRAPASRAFDQIARKLADQLAGRPNPPPFFPRFLSPPSSRSQRDAA